MRRPHVLMALLTQMLCACATVPAMSVSSPSPSSLSGNFELWGQTVKDGCGGIYLAARHLLVDASAATAHADVVERTYLTRVENGRLVAEGRFAAQSSCPGESLFEQWVLVARGEDLEGTLSSHWKVPPSCERECVAEFRILALRVKVEPPTAPLAAPQ